MFLFEFVFVIFILMLGVSLFVLVPLLRGLFNIIVRVECQMLEKANQYKLTPEERMQRAQEEAERKYQDALRKRMK